MFYECLSEMMKSLKVARKGVPLIVAQGKVTFFRQDGLILPYFTFRPTKRGDVEGDLVLSENVKTLAKRVFYKGFDGLY